MIASYHENTFIHLYSINPFQFKPSPTSISTADVSSSSIPAVHTYNAGVERIRAGAGN